MFSSSKSHETVEAKDINDVGIACITGLEDKYFSLPLAILGRRKLIIILKVINYTKDNFWV